MVQELGQVEIPESQRSTFAGTEASFQSLGAVCHSAATAWWNHTSEFRWLALGSVLVTGAATLLFGNWARRPPDRNEQRYEGIALPEIGEHDHDE